MRYLLYDIVYIAFNTFSAPPLRTLTSRAACNWFAKDLPRLQRAKADRKWEPYEVEELRGKTMGVVGWVAQGRVAGWESGWEGG